MLKLPRTVSLTRAHILWAVIFCVCSLMQVFSLQEVLNFDRALIEGGDYWLMLTAHLIHLNWSHWLMNMAGLVIIAVFFSPYGTLGQWCITLVFAALFVSSGLLLFNEEISNYVGFSGVLHGLFVYGVFGEIKRYRLSGFTLALLVMAKLIFEIWYGPLPGSESFADGPVVSDAHIYGAIGGFVTKVCVSLYSRFSRTVDQDVII